MEEFNTSRSRASRALVERDNGELPLKMWDGIADLGLGPWGGECSELMVCEIYYMENKERSNRTIPRHSSRNEEEAGR